jgi:hypothetical protein
MNTMTHPELQAFLLKAGIVVAAPERGIGRELNYQPPARRIVVVQFGPDDSTGYLAQVVSIVLSAEESWLLMPRYGSASQLGDFTTQSDAEALVFAPSERERLCAYLCSRDMAMGAISQDIYLVGADGNVLVAWDHHMEDEGLRVDLRDVKQSTALLADLNTFGAELEVFSTDR